MTVTNFKQLELTFTGQIEVVDLIANLPAGFQPVEGAIRYVDEVHALYVYDGSAWTPVVTGGSPSFDTLTVNTLIVNNFSYLNSNVVEIGDNIIVLNSLVTGAPTQDGGVAINRGTSPDALIQWNETTDNWEVGVVGDMVPFPGAAPGFVFARQGTLPVNTWLLANGIPSNLTGIHNLFTNSRIGLVSADSSSVSTYQFTLYEHDHSVYTVLGSFTVTAAHGGSFTTALPLTAGKNLAIQVSSGSADNLAVTLVLERT